VTSLRPTTAHAELRLLNTTRRNEMTDKTYNGWTNYATWRVNIEIFDGLEQNEMFDLTLPVEQLRHVLQDYVNEYVYELCDDRHRLIEGWISAFLSDVNWYEIAEHMIEDYAEENQEIDLDDGLSAVNEQQE
jgi:hypothetical protein